MKPTSAPTPQHVRLQDLPQVIAAERVVEGLTRALASTQEQVQLMEGVFTGAASRSSKFAGNQAVGRALAVVSGVPLADDQADLAQRLNRERRNLQLLRDGLKAAADERLSIIEQASREHMVSRAPQLRAALLASIDGFERVKASVEMYRAIGTEAASLGYWTDSGGGCAWGVSTRFDENAEHMLGLLRDALHVCEQVMGHSQPDQYQNTINRG